uniref:Uncharacterized protein n=1 Tax=Timema monikensis TaxID=170555 RepID=A0A7R9E7Z9_9NEOP|nr:unnamed protein product [Timema monikensis]
MAARIPRIPLTRILSVVPLLMHALAQVASTTRAPPPSPTHCLVLWRGEKARNPSSREWAMSHYEFRRRGMKPDKVTSTLRVGRFLSSSEAQATGSTVFASPNTCYTVNNTSCLYSQQDVVSTTGPEGPFWLGSTRENEKPFSKKPSRNTRPELNPDLLIFGSLVSCESSALDHAATDVDMYSSKGRWSVGEGCMTQSSMQTTA